MCFYFEMKKQRMNHAQIFNCTRMSDSFIFSVNNVSSGISMTLLESKNGLQYFTFEHGRDYQQVQFKFLDAVESMDPNNIVVSFPVLPVCEDSACHENRPQKPWFICLSLMSLLNFDQTLLK